MCYARAMVAYTFLQSDGRDPLAGGGAYIRHLVDALHRAGHDVDVGDGAVLPPGRVAVVDGLGMAAFDTLAGAVGLIHHIPEAVDPDGRDGQLRGLRHIVATSAIVAARLVKQYGVPNEKLTVLTPGVADVGRSAGSGGPCCEILSIGALVPRKGHAVLIAALNPLFDLDWRLTIVGETQRDPATAAALHALAAQTGRVRFTGPLDDATLETLWQRADLFALATEWEGHAAAVAEALRRGVPVAVTAGGAAAALVTPAAGIVCEVGDVAQLSKALRRLIYDTALRAQMAAAAWQAGQGLPTWAAQAERFVAATA